MVLVKKLKIYYLSVFCKMGQENVFDDILERKKLLYTIYIKKEFKKTKN